MQTNCHYIDGAWVPGRQTGKIAVLNPATEEVIAEIAAAGREDVDRAVQAARRAFPAFSRTSVAERRELLVAISRLFSERLDQFAATVTREVGAPVKMARTGHANAGPAHIDILIEELDDFSFGWQQGPSYIGRKPIGVCGLITPWNVPINQIVIKVAPALAAGCTVVLKPSEVAPLNAMLFAEVLHDAGVPPGVFNLVNGDGPVAGAALAEHPGVDMVSFTGSTRAGVAVAQAAATTVKRVAQELGGKSANILLPDADFPVAVEKGVRGCFNNSGQACSAPSRMLVPRDRMEEAAEIAARVADGLKVGNPEDPATDLGPLVNAQQQRRVRDYILSGMEEGARLVAGGPDMPQGLNHGFFVRPTVFADVRPDMRIAREEIFGPVLSLIPYDGVEEAIAIANDSDYGLAAYVQSASLEAAREVGARLRAGRVHLNYPVLDRKAPFGGFGQSGNGREQGRFGLEEYLEYSAILGFAS